jgi:hypothetical protein
VEKEQARDKVLREIATLIDEHPDSVASALNHSNTFFEYPYTKKDLVDAASYAIVNNRLFQKNISVVIANRKIGLLDKGKIITQKEFVEFSNIGGKKARIDSKKLAVSMGSTIAKGAAGGAKSGKEPISIIVGAIVGTVVGIVDAGFQWGSASKNAKASEEAAKAKIYAELFDKDKKKKNWWIPIAVLGGVLIAGGIVVFMTLKEK